MKTTRMSALLLALLTLVAFAAPLPAWAADSSGVEALPEEIHLQPVFVNCDAGRTIGRVLERRVLRHHLEIVINGTCVEDVLIDRDDVTLRGNENGDPVLVGGIRIENASRVIVEGFTVRDNVNLESGIEAVAGSSVIIRDMVVENSANRGIRIRDSVAEIRDVFVSGSGTVGILVRGSRLSLEGRVESVNANEGGIILTDNTSAFSKEGELITSGNLFGFVVQTSASFEGVFGSLTTQDNEVAGLLVATQGVFVYGITLQSTGNGFAGVWVDESSSLSPFANLTGLASTTIAGNGVVGAFVERGSTLEFAGVTTVTGNPIGVFVDDSILRSAAADVTGNFSSDISLNFGSRASFNGDNVVGVLQCDGTILTRGEIACP